MAALSTGGTEAVCSSIVLLPDFEEQESQMYKSFRTTAKAMERLHHGSVSRQYLVNALDRLDSARRCQLRSGVLNQSIIEVIGEGTSGSDQGTSQGDVSVDHIGDGDIYLAKLRRLQYQLYNNEHERLKDVEKRYETPTQSDSSYKPAKSPPKNPVRWNTINRNSTNITSSPTALGGYENDPPLTNETPTSAAGDIRRLDTPTRHKRMQKRRDAEIRRRRRPRSPPRIDLEGRCLLEPAITSEQWHESITGGFSPRRSAPAAATISTRLDISAGNVRNFLSSNDRPPQTSPDVSAGGGNASSKVPGYFNVRLRNRGGWRKSSTKSADGELMGSLTTLKLPTLQRSRNQLLAAGGGGGRPTGGIMSPERQSLDRLNNRSNQLQRLKLSRKLIGQKIDQRMRSYSYSNGQSSKKVIENGPYPAGSRSVDYLSINVSLPRVQHDQPNHLYPQITFEWTDGHRNSPVSSIADVEDSYYKITGADIPDISVRTATPLNSSPQPKNTSYSRQNSRGSIKSSSSVTPGGPGPLLRLARQNELRDKEVKDLMQDISELHLHNNKLLEDAVDVRQS